MRMACDAIPSVSAATPMPAVIYEMSRKGLGMTTVTQGGKIDWHSERWRSCGGCWSSKGPDALALTAGDAMNLPAQHTISPGRVCRPRLGHVMEEKKITSLVVVDAAPGGRLVSSIFMICGDLS